MYVKKILKYTHIHTAQPSGLHGAPGEKTGGSAIRSQPQHVYTHTHV